MVTIPVFLGATLIIFAIIHLAPGEPAGLQLQMNARAADISKQLKKEYGLDKPLPEQYIDWMGRLFRLDFGLSMSMDRRPVLTKIAEAIPVSLMLFLVEFSLILLVALPLGVFAAVYRHKWPDHLLTIISFALYSSPGFWIALLLMMFFSVQLGWLPISGLGPGWYGDIPGSWESLLDIAAHLTLPILTMLCGSIAGMTRYVRMAMVEVLDEDYMRTAQAKGLSAFRILFQHGLRNGLLPMVTILGLSLPGMIGGSVILESVFALPGMGRLFYQAVMMRDYTLIMAILTIGAFLTLAGNILADILYAVVDPRIRDRYRASG